MCVSLEQPLTRRAMKVQRTLKDARGPLPPPEFVQCHPEAVGYQSRVYDVPEVLKDLERAAIVLESLAIVLPTPLNYSQRVQQVSLFGGVPDTPGDIESAT